MNRGDQSAFDIVYGMAIAAQRVARERLEVAERRGEFLVEWRGICQAIDTLLDEIPEEEA